VRGVPSALALLEERNAVDRMSRGVAGEDWLQLCSGRSLTGW
jgi:hypothetical protein